MVLAFIKFRGFFSQRFDFLIALRDLSNLIDPNGNQPSVQSSSSSSSPTFVPSQTLPVSKNLPEYSNESLISFGDISKTRSMSCPGVAFEQLNGRIL